MRHSIQKHILDADSMQEIFFDEYIYPTATFVDYYVSTDYTYDTDSGMILLVLSREIKNGKEKYYNYFYQLDGRLIMWKTKVLIDTQGYYLRKDNPLIDLNQGEYLILIDEDELVALVTTYDTSEHCFKIRFNTKIHKAHF